MKRKNLVGQKFGKLTVNKMIYNYKNTGKTKCLCSCDCGSNNILRDPYIIEHAKMSSCGCAKREVIINSVGKELVGQRFGKLIVKEINWDKTHVPFAYVTSDGKWHERGKMGWWAIVSDEKDQDEWEAEYRETIRKYLSPEFDKQIEVTVVDCHI